jgi:hypothetical protein
VHRGLRRVGQGSIDWIALGLRCLRLRLEHCRREGRALRGLNRLP